MKRFLLAISDLHHLRSALIFTLVGFSTACAPFVVADENSDAHVEASREFAIKVWPLLREKCFACHGQDPDDIAGDFSITDRNSILRGGESGDAGIIPGDTSAGSVLTAIAWEDLEMPPKENDRLADSQIELVRRWIDRGAPWPDEASQAKFRLEESQNRVTDDGVLVTTSGGTSDQWTHRRYDPQALWAFEPLRQTSEELPQGSDPAAAIDFFIHRAIEAADLSVADSATPRQLIRRVTFDLTGLPPTPAEVDAFEKSYAIDPDAAWATLVDRLLASPRYGEQFARHWLDVTRYADTGGMSNDYERSNMWRYRDYVIRAFNDDKPYDEFIREQIAGDELADASVRKRTGSAEAVEKARQNGDYTPEEAEDLIATGFLRLGPWDDAMVAEDEARQIYLDDVVNITGQTFLATTMRCCKCHDHKFDPIPTRDYYRMYSAFAGTQMAERPVPLLDVENTEGFAEGKAHVQRMLDYALVHRDKLIEKREDAARTWFKERGLEYKNENERKDLDDELKPERAVGLSPREQGELKVREQDEWIWRRALERYEPIAQTVYNTPSPRYRYAAARKLRMAPPEKDANLVNHILTGGALTALGDEVKPGVLSMLGLPVPGDDRDGLEDPYRVTNELQGRRTQFANWVADRDNVLTTRSIVNRIWQFHFGVGLAKNSNNFGGKGEQPTHPELLDYLTNDFVDHGWTMKRMHRNILLSRTYRRGTIAADPQHLQSADPDNRLLSCFPRQRLTAEELRDSMLAVSGELVQSEGGLPVSPEINMEVALEPRMIQFSLAPAYQPSADPELRNRRTIYTYHVRGQADPMNELFNQPGPNESCELRESAAVTPQVFSLLNSDMVTDRSVAMAVRLKSETDTIESQIQRAFDLLFARDASEAEVQRLVEYVDDMTAYHREVQPQAVEYPATLNRSLVEEFTGEPFEYEEILPVFENYQPDLKPADVDASTRALADLCLLLFNSNEFMYLN